jgi:hypothetical protein
MNTLTDKEKQWLERFVNRARWNNTDLFPLLTAYEIIKVEEYHSDLKCDLWVDGSLPFETVAAIATEFGELKPSLTYSGKGVGYSLIFSREVIKQEYQKLVDRLTKKFAR